MCVKGQVSKNLPGLHNLLPEFVNRSLQLNERKPAESKFILRGLSCLSWIDLYICKFDILFTHKSSSSKWDTCCYRWKHSTFLRSQKRGPAWSFLIYFFLKWLTNNCFIRISTNGWYRRIACLLNQKFSTMFLSEWISDVYAAYVHCARHTYSPYFFFWQKSASTRNSSWFWR